MSATAGKPSPLGRVRSASCRPHSWSLQATSGASTPGHEASPCARTRAHACTTAAEPAVLTTVPPLLARTRSANARQTPASWALADAASACSSPGGAAAAAAATPPPCTTLTLAAACKALVPCALPASPLRLAAMASGGAGAQPALTATSAQDLEPSPEEVRGGSAAG